MPQLKVAVVVLVHCNISSNQDSNNSRVMCTSLPNKAFNQLLIMKYK